ncbi:hypothetical protein QAD02_004392 [Eretmocerus hayati]|uniref:Uncharacterized protein n=1 Tax=Eretmocerus hayati TaxID=131215 RepID=A0ACC2NPL4_9HYME|nr:hypothetical protein QAD02_004392 [Eretmocerus hayati]
MFNVSGYLSALCVLCMCEAETNRRNRNDQDSVRRYRRETKGYGTVSYAETLEFMKSKLGGEFTGGKFIKVRRKKSGKALIGLQYGARVTEVKQTIVFSFEEDEVIRGYNKLTQSTFRTSTWIPPMPKSPTQSRMSCRSVRTKRLPFRPYGQLQSDPAGCFRALCGCSETSTSEWDYKDGLMPGSGKGVTLDTTQRPVIRIVNKDLRKTARPESSPGSAKRMVWTLSQEGAAFFTR